MNFFNEKKEEKVSKIIKSFGYNIEFSTTDSMWWLDKEYAPKTLIAVCDDEITVLSKYPINHTGILNHYEVLQFLNDLNCKSGIAQFTYDEESKTITFHAIYTGKYTDDKFCTFMNAWETDVLHMLNSHPKTHTFLGDDGMWDNVSSEPVQASA